MVRVKNKESKNFRLFVYDKLDHRSFKKFQQNHCIRFFFLNGTFGRTDIYSHWYFCHQTLQIHFE